VSNEQGLVCEEKDKQEQKKASLGQEKMHGLAGYGDLPQLIY